MHMEPMKLSFVFLAIFLLVIFASGCTQPYSEVANDSVNSSSDNSTRSANFKLYEVVIIKDLAFDPSEVTIRRGGTVTWINDDSVPHTIMSDPHPLHSGLPALASKTLSTGESYSFTFNTIGTFGYHCEIHQSMKGKVVVKE